MHIWEESKLFDAFFLKPSVYSSQNICHFSFQKVHSLLFLEITWRRTLHPARSARLTFEWKKGMRVRKWISGEDCYMYNLADTVAYSTEAYLPCGHTSHDNPPLVKAFKGTFHEDCFFFSRALPQYQLTHFGKNNKVVWLSTVFLEICIYSVSLALGLSVVSEEEAKKLHSSWNRSSPPQPTAIRTRAPIIISGGFSALFVCKDDIIFYNLTPKWKVFFRHKSYFVIMPTLKSTFRHSFLTSRGRSLLVYKLHALLLSAHFTCRFLSSRLSIQSPFAFLSSH